MSNLEPTGPHLDTTATPFDTRRTDLDRSPLEIAGLLSQPIRKELRTFLAVAKSRSYAQAASMLNASAPTVSRDVRRLEEQIGSQLVVSSFSGVRLTATGHALAVHLADLDYRLSSLSNNLRQEQGSVAGRVSVSVTSGLSVAFVAPAVTRLNEKYPLIEVDLRGQASLVNFEKNQTDIMISMAPVHRSDILCRDVGTLHLIPLASRAYIKFAGVPNRQSLRQHKFLQCKYYASDAAPWSHWNAVVADGQVTHHCEDSLAYYALVKAGAGIGLLGNYTLIEPDLRPLDLGVHIPIKVYVLVLNDRMRSKPVEAAVDWISGIFKENPFFASGLNLVAGTSEPENDFRRFFNLSP